ncbi:hypothetical protein U1Q18_015683, partial [Sarracenia purpurea var. burkii]
MADRDWPIDDDGDTASPEFRFFFSEMDDGYEFFRRRWVTVKFRVDSKDTGLVGGRRMIRFDWDTGVQCHGLRRKRVTVVGSRTEI